VDDLVDPKRHSGHEVGEAWVVDHHHLLLLRAPWAVDACCRDRRRASARPGDAGDPVRGVAHQRVGVVEGRASSRLPRCCPSFLASCRQALLNRADPGLDLDLGVVVEGRLDTNGSPLPAWAGHLVQWEGRGWRVDAGVDWDLVGRPGLGMEARRAGVDPWGESGSESEDPSPDGSDADEARWARPCWAEAVRAHVGARWSESVTWTSGDRKRVGAGAA